MPTSSGDPGEPGGAAASQHVHQHGLRLIVTRVPDEDRARVGVRARPFQGRVPRFACASLEIGTRRDLDGLHS